MTGNLKILRLITSVIYYSRVAETGFCLTAIKRLKTAKKALELCQPDLVHIHGTEYAPGYEMLKVCGDVPVLLTIQGILRRISKEYYGGLTFNERLKCLNALN